MKQASKQFENQISKLSQLCRCDFRFFFRENIENIPVNADFCYKLSSCMQFIHVEVMSL